MEVEEMWMSNNRDIGWSLVLEHKRVGEMGLVEHRDQTMQMTEMRARKVAKKCQYCDSTETLHWRKGYMLCNECISLYQLGRQSSEHNPLKIPEFDPCSRSQLDKNVEQISEGPKSVYGAKTEVRKSLNSESSLLDETKESIPSQQGKTRKMTDLLDCGYSDQAVKKCMHCQTTETPRWRRGPMDQKILCYACGVQHKHGRLFADDRPLKSPTFNPYLYFDKPKKVQKIRMCHPSEEDLSTIPTGPKLKKVKKGRMGNNAYDRDPNCIPKPKKVKMTTGGSCERDGITTPTLKKVAMRKTKNIKDLGQTIISESKRAEEMTLVNINGSSLNLTSEAKSVKEMSSGNYYEIRMGYTSEEGLNLTSEGPKLMKAKGIRRDDNTYERHPNFIPEPKNVEMTTGSTCERDRNPNPNPKVKKVEIRKTSNIIDLGQTIISESERAEEMTLVDIDGSSLKLTSDAKSVLGMSSGIYYERDWNQAYTGSSFQEMRQKASNLLESDSCERNENSDFNWIIKQKPVIVTKAKKCTHCKSTTTPQWREGPMGRKTLCNACGVQYKRGKLFPEYRPLKSPTYDPLLHSHLPKKVMEMRKRNAEKCVTSYNREEPL